MSRQRSRRRESSVPDPLTPDPSTSWVYGLGESNRKNLETIIRYCHQQGLIRRAMPVEELFINTDPEDGGDVNHV